MWSCFNKAWSCFNKTCPCCYRYRGNSMQPFGNLYYDDEDNVEFENLLIYQDRSSLANLLSGTPFSRSNHPPAYGRVNMVLPNEDALLDDDGENLQTQDAQFLPDEQIDKFSERVTRSNPVTDAQLAAEEEEVRRQEEEEIRRKRQAATQAALAKGLITPEQASANKATPQNKDSQISSLNKPRNPHERLFVPDVNMEDYDDVTDFEY
ncbi:12714_t:CDS:2, partial [Dentiscutata heterogama]